MGLTALRKRARSVARPKALALLGVAAALVGSSSATGGERSEAELLEELGAIGYVDGSTPMGDRTGVTVREPAAMAPGLNLMTSGHGPTAILMDAQGVVRHTWRAELSQVFPAQAEAEKTDPPRRNFWRIVRLLPDGELLVLWELYGLFKLDRDSNVLWARPGTPHHDLQVTPDRHIHHLAAARVELNEIPGRKSIDDFVVERSPEGEELRRLSISKALREIDWPDLRRAFWVRNQARGYGLRARGRFDPFHTNSLQILGPAEAERMGEGFQPGDTLVSMAMLDTIAILEPRSGRVRWWQQGPFGMQHHPRVTLDGGIVVFDNFAGPRRSAVTIFDPRTHRALWQYGAAPDEPLYSKRSGGADVLPGGNLLIAETDAGRALEVTPQRRVVWEYRNPNRAASDPERVAGIYSIQRIPGSELGWLDAPDPDGAGSRRLTQDGSADRRGRSAKRIASYRVSPSHASRRPAPPRKPLI